MSLIGSYDWLIQLQVANCSSGTAVL